MSAEPRRVTNADVWRQWENQVVNGVFPLRRFLGGSNHSAVFLTEYKAENFPDAAIKFVRADATHAKAQLVQWGAAASLSHPHLMRLFDVGRCQLGGQDFLFVVMEYAEQSLAQILPRRALVPEEVRELLVPALDALAFLHRNRLVHSQLKPSNFLAVNDQLKLAGDTVRPAGNSTIGIVRTTSPYDPPELKDSGISTAGDIWSLGVTLAEALTQRTPTLPDQQSETAVLPASLPAPFEATVRRCLSLAPADRPSVIELETLYKTAPQASSISSPQLPAHAAPRKAPPPRSFLKRHLSLLVIAGVILLLLAVWIGLRFLDTSPAQLQPPVTPAPAAAVHPPPLITPSAIEKSAASGSRASSPAVASPDPTAPAVPSAVLHEVTPDISSATRAKIRGLIPVRVRVLVDPSGDVFGALLDNPGPSKYFARRAEEAAREWKFAPADSPDTRVWLLRFEFSRDGVAVQATAE